MTYFYWDNKIDGLSLTASSEWTGFEIENIQNIQRYKTWRSTGITSENIVIDSGLGNTITGSALIISKHNLTSSVVITLQGNATDSWGSPTFSQVQTYDHNDDTIFIANTTATASYRFWRIVIADSTNTNSYIEIGRVFFGNGLLVDKGASDSFSETVQNTTLTSYSNNGQAYSDIGYTYREFDLFFPFFEDTMKQSVKTMFATIGKHKPIFVVIDSENIDKLQIRYCIITSDESYTHLPTANYNWSMSINFREVN